MYSQYVQYPSHANVKASLTASALRCSTEPLVALLESARTERSLSANTLYSGELGDGSVAVFERDVPVSSIDRVEKRISAVAAEGDKSNEGKIDYGKNYAHTSVLESETNVGCYSMYT